MTLTKYGVETMLYSLRVQKAKMEKKKRNALARKKNSMRLWQAYDIATSTYYYFLGNKPTNKDLINLLIREKDPDEEVDKSCIYYDGGYRFAIDQLKLEKR